MNFQVSLFSYSMHISESFKLSPSLVDKNQISQRPFWIFPDSGMLFQSFTTPLIGYDMFDLSIWFKHHFGLLQCRKRIHWLLNSQNLRGKRYILICKNFCSKVVSFYIFNGYTIAICNLLATIDVYSFWFAYPMCKL